jgi:hypothetical protein
MRWRRPAMPPRRALARAKRAMAANPDTYAFVEARMDALAQRLDVDR